MITEDMTKFEKNMSTLIRWNTSFRTLFFDSLRHSSNKEREILLSQATSFINGWVNDIEAEKLLSNAKENIIEEGGAQ